MTKNSPVETRTKTPYVEWFRDHLDELPVSIRDDVQFAISQDNARLIYIDLSNIEERAELPENWKGKILEYYYWIF